tara:strand:- start:165687 stop:166310 length:624 start_codon:yes stop_codon:yes gene_type:complete
MFITIEGIEGVGKTTNLKHIAEYLHHKELPVLITREPGGTPLANDIRSFLLNEHNEKIHPDTELLLMFAARSQHVQRIIKPALEAEKWVICDRFTDASYAYQGAGRGIDMDRIAALESWVQGQLRPDLTILLDAPLEIALQRIKKRGKLDRFESEEISFFRRVRQCYLDRAQAEPDRFIIINTDRDLPEIQKEIDEKLDETLLKSAC